MPRLAVSWLAVSWLAVSWLRVVGSRCSTKEKPGFWTRRRVFEQARHGSNIQLLSFSLVTDRPAGHRSHEGKLMHAAAEAPPGGW